MSAPDPWPNTAMASQPCPSALPVVDTRPVNATGTGRVFQWLPRTRPFDAFDAVSTFQPISCPATQAVKSHSVMRNWPGVIVTYPVPRMMMPAAAASPTIWVGDNPRITNEPKVSAPPEAPIATQYWV